MVETVPGTQVFFRKDQLLSASMKTSASTKARFLLFCIYTNEELVAAGSLTRLDAEIISAIVSKFVTGAVVRDTLLQMYR